MSFLVAYLVVFHLLFVMFLWSYGMVTNTAPGFARDVRSHTP